MREIKFRVWDEEKYYYNVGVGNGEIQIYENTNGKMIKPRQTGYIGIDCDGLFVEQFTGLYDKNGKEIYEGDIISDGFHNRKVYFKDAQFQTEYDSLLWDLQDNAMEVVGNIHKNPELLK